MSRKDAADLLGTFDLLASPGHLLRRNHQRSLDIFTRLVGSDVTRLQVAVLVVLNRYPGASQRDLVEATGVDKSTLKEMLNRMVTRGWVQRERDPGDSRAWAMQLTDEGQKLLLERIEQVAAAQREILAPLQPSEQAAFMRYMRLLLELE